MKLRAIAASLSAALLLAGCGEPAPPEGFDTPPSPPLFEVSREDGRVEGWLFGTIHALPDGTKWRTERLDAIVRQADLLVIEVAALDDRAASAAHFNRLAITPGQPDILTRVPANLRPALAGLIDRTGRTGNDFADLETWAAALVLAEGVRFGETENGVDRALLRRFDKRRVRELESIAFQLGIFDALPEKEQRDLLAAVAGGYRRFSEDPARLARAWRSGDVAALEAEYGDSMLADPELRDALLTRRNTAWARRLAGTFAEEPLPLVAVGAAHLLGPDSLVEMLAERGYTVRRIQ